MARRKKKNKNGTKMLILALIIFIIVARRITRLQNCKRQRKPRDQWRRNQFFSGDKGRKKGTNFPRR